MTFPTWRWLWEPFARKDTCSGCHLLLWASGHSVRVTSWSCLQIVSVPLGDWFLTPLYGVSIFSLLRSRGDREHFSNVSHSRPCAHPPPGSVKLPASPAPWFSPTGGCVSLCWWKCPVSELSKMAAARHTSLLSAWNVAGVAEEMKFKWWLGWLRKWNLNWLSRKLI